MGKLLDGTECQILLNTWPSKSFMSKTHYLRCKSLQSVPEFAYKIQRIQVGNGQYVSVLFIIPYVTLQWHRKLCNCNTTPIDLEICHSEYLEIYITKK